MRTRGPTIPVYVLVLPCLIRVLTCRIRVFRQGVLLYVRMPAALSLQACLPPDNTRAGQERGRGRCPEGAAGEALGSGGLPGGAGDVDDGSNGALTSGGLAASHERDGGGSAAGGRDVWGGWLQNVVEEVEARGFLLGSVLVIFLVIFKKLVVLFL